MANAEQAMVGAMRSLAERFAPNWQVPAALQWYGLPDRELVSLFHLIGAGLDHLRISHGIWQDRIEAIENLTYYQRGDLGTYIGLESWYNARHGDNRSTKFNLDRCHAYHMLWWIDMAINVHTTP